MPPLTTAANAPPMVGLCHHRYMSHARRALLGDGLRAPLSEDDAIASTDPELSSSEGEGLIHGGGDGGGVEGSPRNGCGLGERLGEGLGTYP